jgi:hypothetical protein
MQKRAAIKKYAAGFARPNITDASFGLLVVLTDTNCAVGAPILHSAR